MAGSETEIETLMILKYLEMGLVPHNLDLKAALKNMDPIEAKKVKRKFRKIQRRVRKKLRAAVKEKKTRKGWKKAEAHKGRPTPERRYREANVSSKIKRTDAAWGKPGEDPDYRQRAQRKRLLFSETYKEVTKVLKPTKPQLGLFSK